MRPHKEKLTTDCQLVDNVSLHTYLKTTKEIYKQLLTYQTTVSTNEKCTVLTSFNLVESTDIYNVFEKQLCSKLENKLKEFNLKILYGILACEENLRKWKIKESDNCYICNVKHTIEHMLFSCKHAKYMWQIVMTVYKINVNYQDIVCGHENQEMRFVITIIAFLLYKEWLLPSLDVRERRPNFPITYFTHELKLRRDIYLTNMLTLQLDPLIMYLECIS